MSLRMRRLRAFSGEYDEFFEKVAAVKGKTKIIADGGIRHGVDMAKALAIGADAVLICRPFAVMWFGGGVDGAKTYIEMLQ